MNRRHFLWGALAVAFFWKKLKSEPSQRWVKNEQYPIHECADRPYLPCPACMKWTSDEFATVKSNRRP
jgi:hypothetical protein